MIAGEGVGPGAWMYHCHVQSHSDMGMAGIFLVTDADGNVPYRAAVTRAVTTRATDGDPTGSRATPYTHGPS